MKMKTIDEIVPKEIFTKMSNVFISFSFKDQKIAEAIVCALESKKVKCWISYRDADLGEEYAASIVRAIKQSELVLLVFSENSNSSKHVLNEINSAVNAGKTIIPFKLSEFDLDESFEYYLGKTHWLDAVTPPIQKHIDILCEKIEKYLHKTAPDNTSSINSRQYGECRMVTYEELLSFGYTASSIAIQLVENDYIVYNGIDEANEGTAAQWEELIQDFSDNTGYMINSENKIIGDWNIAALSNEKMILAINGKLLEKDISYDDVEFIGFPGEYNGYILAMGLLPEYRSNKNHMKLLNSWLQYIADLSENGVFFKKWCINVFNKETEVLIKGLGFRYQCDNFTFGKIYTLDFLPLPNSKFFTNNKRLAENYERYYNENV